MPQAEATENDNIHNPTGADPHSETAEPSDATSRGSRAERLRAAVDKWTASPAKKRSAAPAKKNTADDSSEPPPEEVAAASDAPADEAASADDAPADEAVPDAVEQPAPEPTKDQVLLEQLLKEVRESPESAGILQKLLKQGGLAGAFVSLKKHAKEVKQREQAIERQLGTIANERKALEHSIAQHQRELAEWQDLRTKTPREAARRLGLTLRDFADEAERGAEPEDKRLLRELQEQHAAAAAEIKKQREQHEQELKELREQLERQAAERTEREDRQWIAEGWEQARDEFPYLSAYSAQVVLDSAYGHLLKLMEAGATGADLDRRSVFSSMNDWAEDQKANGQWTEAQIALFNKANPPAQPAKVGSSERAGQGIKPNPAPATSPATLSNTDAVERESPPRRRNKADRLESALRVFSGN